jgi:hypothetical protein
MKKFLLALLIFPLSALGQTKEETQAWIISKIPYNYDLKYTIEDDKLVSTMPGRHGGNNYKRSMPISAIKTISHVHTDTYLSFALKCDDECAYLIATDSRDKFVSEAKKDVMLFELYGKLDAELIPRMEKALLRLVELNGGKAKIIPFQKKKEAF